MPGTDPPGSDDDDAPNDREDTASNDREDAAPSDREETAHEDDEGGAPNDREGGAPADEEAASDPVVDVLDDGIRRAGTSGDRDVPDDGTPADGGESSGDEATSAELLEDALYERSTGQLGTSDTGDGSGSFRDLIGSNDEPVPEEALSDPLVHERSVRATDREALRDTYGYVRAFFKARPERYRGLQRRLKQARSSDTYDEYLADSVWRALAAGVAATALGAALLVALVVSGVGGGRLGFPFAAAQAGGGVPSTATLVVILSLALLCGVAATGIAWTVRNSYYPRSVVAARQRSIALNLPHAITFTYALSSGGTTFVEVCRRLGENEAVYGEVATEFDLVVREIELFGTDLLQALDNVRAVTPSENFRRFLDDLLGVLESGGDLEAFLEEEAEELLDDAIEEQESFIETLGALSEVFVIGFVAAPLFLIVVLVVVSFLGAETVGTVALLVYVAFPLAMGGFLLVVGLYSRPFDEPTASRNVEDERTVERAQVETDPRFPAYERAKRETGLRASLADPWRAIQRRPTLSLGLTVPVGLAVVALAVWTGTLTPTVEGVLAAPVRTTVGLFVVPLVLATVPVTVLHERERRRQMVVTERFPDVLGILASANRMGVDVVDAFDLVTRWASGTLAEELETVRNDIAWNHDLTRALLAFADRLHVAQLTRTMTLVAEGSRSTGDLHGLLSTAAEDTRARAKLARARRRKVSGYVTIVVVGFLVYLLVVLLIGASYLDPIAEMAATTEAAEAGGPVALGELPVDQYRVLFLHSALVQGFGCGLIAGKLAENDVRSGLKYSLGLVALTVVAFGLLV